MSMSHPSLPVYVVDVPEVVRLHATFRYNFFTPDESVNESGSAPASVLSRKASDVDADFVQYSTTRAPRFVEFSWARPRLADVGNLLSERAVRDAAFMTTGEQNGTLILDNIDKVVSEDDFAASLYTSVHFHDGEIDDKIHGLVSGSYTVLTLNEPTDPNVSAYKAAQQLAASLPDHIDRHWLYRSMTLPKQANGATYYVAANGASGNGTAKGAASSANRTRYVNEFFERLKDVNANVQMNSKLMHDLVDRALRDPTSMNANDLAGMHALSKHAKQASAARRLSPAESDYRSYAPYFWVRKHGSNPHVQKYGAELVGFIIDKLEVMPDGSLRTHAPIVVDSPHVNVAVDYRVKFNARYCYTIRTIALLTMPAVEDVSGELATVKVLVCSKPSGKAYVSTLKLNPPPPPGDVGFVWNYQTNRLMVTWAFPVTSERDVKQFQVFKRRSVEHCFELQKQYDFDDSVAPFPYNERPDARLVERIGSPVTSWVDDDFDWDVNTGPEKGVIYGVCAVDAHGQSSGYSAQFRVWFDRFKNSLRRELVSHSGAPKPYPNLYLQGGLFENTIRVSGPNARRVRVVFNPEFYFYTDDDDRTVRVFQTKQTGGAYKLQFINLDSLKAADLTITIDDRTTQSRGQAAQEPVPLGARRKAQPDA